MKYAVLESGGKQYLVREGETVEVDRLPLDVGKPLQWKEVLMVVDDSKVKIGTPTVKGASVKGRVVSQVKGPKIRIFKYIPKQRYRRRKGHRQQYTRVEVEKISLTAPKKKAAASTSKAASETSSGSKKSTKKTESKEG
jgi:large subunit ribosomal protein L21